MATPAGIHVTALQMSVGALIISLVSLIFTGLNYRRSGVHVKAKIRAVEVVESLRDLRIKFSLVNNRLSEVDVRGIHLWFFGASVDIQNECISGDQAFQVRMLPNQTLDWSILLLSSMQELVAYIESRSGGRALKDTARIFRLEWFLASLVPWRSVFIDSFPSLIVDLGGDRYTRAGGLRLSFAMYKTMKEYMRDEVAATYDGQAVARPGSKLSTPPTEASLSEAKDSDNQKHQHSEE